MTPSLNFFLPYQKAWIDDPAATAIAEKSRRIGFTYAESFRSVQRRVQLGTHHYFASRDKESAGEFIEYCKRWARIFGAVAEDLGEQVIDEDKAITAFVLKFTNGAKIVALSSNPDAFRSKGGDVTLDEFAFHKSPRQVLKAANASAKVWGYSLRIISTHNGEGSLFNLLCQSIREGKRPKWALHHVTLLDAVNEGLVEKIKNLPAPDPVAREKFIDEIHADCLDESEWEEEYFCKPSSDQSSLLSYDLIQSCEVANLEVVAHVGHLRQSGQLYAGFDVGRKRDLSVLWVLERVGDVYWTRLLKPLANVNFTAQEEMLAMLLANGAVKRLCLDATGIGAMLAERLADRFGKYRAEAVTFSAPVKSELAMPLKRLFEDKLIRIPATAEVREDLHKIRKIVTAAGNVRLDADRDADGHADRFWALALAYHASDGLKTPLPAPINRKPVGW